MRAAEAIRLGSLVIRPASVFNGDGEGCALAMGNYALSGKMGTEEILKYGFLGITGTPLPCGCKSVTSYGFPIHATFISSIVVHLFDYHVMKGNWTIDRLCEWLDSVDPTPREVCDMGASPLCEHENLQKEDLYAAK